MPDTPTPGQYLKQRRLAAGWTHEDIALRIETSPPVAAIVRAALVALIETDMVPMRITTALTLGAIPELRIDLAVLARLADAVADDREELPAFRFLGAPTLAEIEAG